jgi:hypothetical protein
MKTTLTVEDLTAEQWALLHQDLLVSYTFGPLDARVCTVFVHGQEERHAEMPAWTLVQLLGRLTAVEVMHRPPMVGQVLPTLPTPDQVRHLSAEQAAQLAADMNRPTTLSPVLDGPAEVGDRVEYSVSPEGRVSVRVTRTSAEDSEGFQTIQVSESERRDLAQLYSQDSK